MKKTIISIAFAMLAMTLVIGTNAQEKSNKKEAEVTFISDIDCPSCQKKLESKLPHEPGVKDLKIDLEKKTIWFKFDPQKTDKIKLAKALEKLGYASREDNQEAAPAGKGQGNGNGKGKGKGEMKRHGKTD